LEKEILHAISSKGEILDEASPNLKEIRHQIRAVKEKARGALAQLLETENGSPSFKSSSSL